MEWSTHVMFGQGINRWPLNLWFPLMINTGMTWRLSFTTQSKLAFYQQYHINVELWFPVSLVWSTCGKADNNRVHTALLCYTVLTNLSVKKMAISHAV